MKTITNYVELGVKIIADPDKGRYCVEKDDVLIYEIWNNGAGNLVEIICHKECKSIVISCYTTDDEPRVESEMVTINVDHSGLEGCILINIATFWDNVVFMWA